MSKKLKTYIVERTDVSWCEVQATSKEEALEIANDSPEIWEFDTGIVEANEV